jgi:hypothetical protein
MMRALRRLAASAALLAFAAAGVRAASGTWPDLARRIAAADKVAPLNVTLGAEPPRFDYPVARPAGTVLGSTWYASSPDGPPEIAHVYYVPDPDAGTKAEQLSAALVAAGYVGLGRDRMSAHPGYEPPDRFCPADDSHPAVDVAVERAGGVPAMDVRFVQHGGSIACSVVSAGGMGQNAPVPTFTSMPGMSYTSRFPMIGVRGALHSSATVRTALPAAEAVAAFAQRFRASGWDPSPPTVSGDTIVQSFLRTGYHRPGWDVAWLVFDRRSEGVYDVLIDFRDTLPAPAGTGGVQRRGVELPFGTGPS